MSNTLHWWRFWFSLGILLLFAIIILSLIPSPPKLDVAYEDKYQHVLAYFILMGWFIQLYPKRTQQHRLAIGFIALGFLIEGLQGLGGVRFAEWTDVLANSFGVGLAWLLGMTAFSTTLSRFESGLRRLKTRT